jgi:hypothetical protein
MRAFVVSVAVACVCAGSVQTRPPDFGLTRQLEKTARAGQPSWRPMVKAAGVKPEQ